MRLEHARHDLEPAALDAVRSANEGRRLSQPELLTVARCGWLSLVPAKQLTPPIVMAGKDVMGASVIEAAARTGRIADIPTAVREAAWFEGCGHPDISTSMVCRRNGTLAAACADVTDHPGAEEDALRTNQTQGMEELLREMAAAEHEEIQATAREAGMDVQADTILHAAAVHRRFDLLPQKVLQSPTCWMVRNSGNLDSPLHVMCRHMLQRCERTFPAGLTIPPEAWTRDNRLGETPLDIISHLGFPAPVSSPATKSSALRMIYKACSARDGHDRFVHGDRHILDGYRVHNLSGSAKASFWGSWTAAGRPISERLMDQHGLRRLSPADQAHIVMAAARTGNVMNIPESLWDRCAIERDAHGNCPLHEAIRCQPKLLLSQSLPELTNLRAWTTSAGGSVTALDLAIENKVADLVPKEVLTQAVWGPVLAMLPGTPVEDVARIARITERLNASLQPASPARSTLSSAPPIRHPHAGPT